MKLYTLACWDGESGMYANINDIPDDLEAAATVHRLAEDYEEVAIWRGETLIQRVRHQSQPYVN